LAGTFRIVTLGDSVAWGQGLLESETYDVLVAGALNAKFPGGVTLEPRLAHSGAVTGAEPATGDTAPGEVPEARLTVIEQCDRFTNSPDTVDLVLMNGGINDVGVTRILNPFAVLPPLATEIRSACHDHMLVLLNKVSAKFTKPSCRIIVTGYYPILSNQSDPVGVQKLLSLHGVAAPEFVDELSIVDPVIDRCERFFQDSDQQRSAAVRDSADPRIMFVSSAFTDANAASAPQAFLFGLDDELNPQDPGGHGATPGMQCGVSPAARNSSSGTVLSRVRGTPQSGGSQAVQPTDSCCALSVLD